MAETFITVSIDGRQFASIDKGLKAFERGFRSAINRSSVPIGKELKRMLTLVLGEMRKRHSTPFTKDRQPVTGLTNRLLKRTGKGLDSIKKTIKVNSGAGDFVEITGQIGAPFPMSVHERGKTIRPKRAKFLAIPLPAAVDSKGVLRMRPREWPDTFVGRSSKGNLLIFQVSGTGIIPLFLLKRKVKIPARLGMGKALTKELPFFQKRLIDMLDRRLARV